MTMRTILVCLSSAAFALFAASACEINHCEEGATCGDFRDSDSRKSECTTYCGRLSVCGAGQAQDFDRCVDSCKDRYERLPDETHRLCACAERSSCGDVIEGRCSDSNGSGGSCNSCGNGGAPSGSGGAPSGSGGAPSGNGGATSGGAPSGGGATSTNGGASTGGVSSGSGGETSGMTCQAACDCPATQNCVAGHCVPL